MDKDLKKQNHQDTANFIKIHKNDKDKKRDKGYKKAAILLVLLGKDHAVKVLKHLSEEEALGISKEIASIKKVPEKEGKKVLEEFGYFMKVKDLVARGGIEKAKEMLFAAFGEEKGEELYLKILEKTVPHPFSFLNDLPFEQVLLLLKDESSPVISVILSHIDPVLSSKVLGTLPLGLQKEVVVRIAKMEKIPPDVLRKTEEVLKEKVRAQGEIVTQTIDGKTTLIEILKTMDVTKEKEILKDLASTNPELAIDIEKRLFSLDIIHKISKKDLQKILQNYSDMEIAFLLKGKDDNFSEKIIRCVSLRRGEIIKTEYQGIGKVLKSDVDKADAEFLKRLRNMAENKEIVIIDREDEYIE